MVRVLAQTTVFLLALATALVVASAASGEADKPFSDTPFAPEITPAPGPFTAHGLLLAQAWHLLVVVLWLSGASFAAGMLVAAAARRRASLWAAVAVATFLGIILAVGVRPAPAAALRPIVAGGGLLILTAAAAGGWIGRRVWHGTLRESAPAAHDRDQSR